MKAEQGRFGIAEEWRSTIATVLVVYVHIIFGSGNESCYFYNLISEVEGPLDMSSIIVKSLIVFFSR
jgi:hypothetical protein